MLHRMQNNTTFTQVSSDVHNDAPTSMLKLTGIELMISMSQLRRLSLRLILPILARKFRY